MDRTLNDLCEADKRGELENDPEWQQLRKELAPLFVTISERLISDTFLKDSLTLLSSKSTEQEKTELLNHFISEQYKYPLPPQQWIECKKRLLQELKQEAQRVEKNSEEIYKYHCKAALYEALNEIYHCDIRASSNFPKIVGIQYGQKFFKFLIETRRRKFFLEFTPDFDSPISPNIFPRIMLKLLKDNLSKTDFEILLADAEGIQMTDYAKEIGISANTAHKRLSRVRSKTKKIFEKQ